MLSNLMSVDKSVFTTEQTAFDLTKIANQVAFMCHYLSNCMIGYSDILFPYQSMYC